MNDAIEDRDPDHTDEDLLSPDVSDEALEAPRTSTARSPPLP